VSQKLEGLWLGGEISREAAHEVQRAIEYHLDLKTGGPEQPQWHLPPKVAHELENLSNAIRAQIQRLPPPMSDLV
jgi:hypothetical protein